MSPAARTAPPSPAADRRAQFADDLIRTTRNFRTTTWLGHEPANALVVGSVSCAEALRAELTRAAREAGVATPVVAPV